MTHALMTAPPDDSFGTTHECHANMVWAGVVLFLGVVATAGVIGIFTILTMPPREQWKQDSDMTEEELQREAELLAPDSDSD